MAVSKRPLALFILDGWGLAAPGPGNAITLAHKPIIDNLWETYPHTQINTSGEDVGLPEGQMGNSEVGHLNIGAGRVVYQELTRINKSVREGTFYDNPVLLEAMDKARTQGGALHLMGLLSDGGVHSHINHLFALLQLAHDQDLSRVFVHCFLDGRDVPPTNAKDYILLLSKHLEQLNTGKIASVMGRYYAMDRDKRWERIESAYQALVAGNGYQVVSALEAVKQAYDRGETDEFVKPTVVVDEQGPIGRVEDGDVIIFYNFRPDRARQLTRAFVDKDFNDFAASIARPKVYLVCMTMYDKTIEAPVAYQPQTLLNTLGEVLSYHGLKQLRLAETEKYAHVTFFFNGGVEKPNEGEDRILIPSPQVATYDLQPSMSAEEVTEMLVEKIKEDIYDVIIVNYANTDMVGHTGVLSAAVKAVETVDGCLGKGIQAVLKAGGIALITADHGNAEVMLDENGGPCTNHTTGPVPFLLIGEEYKNAQLRTGCLQDIAPTMLQLLQIDQPSEMTGHSLIR